MGCNPSPEPPALSQGLTRCPREMCEAQRMLFGQQGLQPDKDPRPWHRCTRAPRPEGGTWTESSDISKIIR